MIVDIVRSRRRHRSAALRYESGGRFVLTVPYSADDEWVQSFIFEKRRWMERAAEKAEAELETRKIVPGIRIETEFYSLGVALDPQLRGKQYRVVKSKLENSSTFHLSSDFFAPENSDKLYANLEKYLLAQMTKHGSQALLNRAEYWANFHKIRVKDFFVRVQKSRLGYCTFDNRIMLNARLLFAPPEIRDYVICHELAHTKHKNHSKAFWGYLETLFPGAKKADRTLKDRRLYVMSV